MTSLRKRKKQASRRGLALPELELVELLGEVLETLRWTQVLGYSNQFLLAEKLAIPAAERDRVLAAAARAAAQEQKLALWRQRLARIAQELQRRHDGLPAGEASR